MEFISNIDSQLFLFLNGFHADWLDPIMIAITQMWAWLPIYLFLIYLVVKQYGKHCWMIFLAIGFAVLCSDQLSSHVCKPVFQRLRPCYNIDLQDLIYLPKGKAGGHYGFVSSHAANTFAIGTFLTAALRKNTKWIGWLLFVWAFLSSYSRIYIGYHYPGDILCGAVLGILIGLIIWKLYQLLIKRIGQKELK